MKLSTAFASLSALVALTSGPFLATAHNDMTSEEATIYQRDYAAAHQTLDRRCSPSARRRRHADILARSSKGWPAPARKRMYEQLTEQLGARDDGNSSACILAPEVTQGPYHILGELVRQNISDTDQEGGIPLTLQLSFTDIETCEPLTNWWIDVWHANATGFYSGYTTEMTTSTGGGGGGGGAASGNSTGSGNSTMSGGSSTMSGGSSMGGSAPTSSSSAASTEYTSPTEGADSTSNTALAEAPGDELNFHRGVWQTDSDGLLEMYTLFPGFYSGRSVHIHVRAYAEDDGYKADNGSFVSKALSHHTGQLFFTDELIATINENYSPYSENPLSFSEYVNLTSDQWYPYQDSMGYDAVANIAYVDESDITQGMIATIDIAVNSTYSSPELSSYWWDPDATTTSSAATSTSTNGTSS